MFNTVKLKTVSVHRIRYLCVWLLVAGMSLVSASSYADEDDDPAGRVARVSFIRGSVYVQTADDNEWSDATINRPLTTGDQLWTDANARSELQMGNTTVQVDANTQLRIAELTDNELQLVVTQGLVNVRLRNLDRDDNVEISTPDASVIPVEPGTYRIEIADRDDVTVVQVRDGRAQIAGAKQDFKLSDGERLTLRGDDRLTAEFDRVAGADEFDQWSQARNDRAQRVAAARYVSADVIGYEDLDEYGGWRHYNDYGDVWIPTRIQSGWAPYRYGHWAWVSPWGWTWIDDAPWGFAPFHYGRWAMVDRRWCWVPGPRTVRAVYAPALVAWVGTPGVNVSINIGSRPVGWIPLGPREVYRPYYRGSHAYVTRVNLSNARFNNTEFERDYRRQPRDNDYRNHSAVSVVRADTLHSSQSVGGRLIRTNQKQLQPLTAQPVARPERSEANRSRQIAPPLKPSTREVATGRDMNRRGEANHGGTRDAPRDSARPDNRDAAPADNPRGNDVNRWRGRDNNDATSNTRDVDRRNNARPDNDANRVEPRNPSRDRFNGQHNVNPATPRAEPAAPIIERSNVTPTQRPDAAPHVWNERGSRQQAQPARQETAPPATTPPVHMERQRNMRIPNDPGRNEPAASPRTPANNDSGRPGRGGDDRPRGDRGRDVR